MFVKDPPTLFEKLRAPPATRFLHRCFMFLLPWCNSKNKSPHPSLMEAQRVHFRVPPETTVGAGSEGGFGCQRSNLLPWWWRPAAPSDPPAGATRPDRVPLLHFFAWLAGQPGLDSQHLSADSFVHRCEVTPRHICRGAGDPCNLPLSRPPSTPPAPPPRPSPC